jgi:2-polyprenyl-3-methyl-5-hydroxy-6-metoxy-1,4-benzoquinol methylase
MESLKCWCGNEMLSVFSQDYLRCSACETLISIHVPEGDITRVIDDAHDFYGREYWFAHQEKDLGFESIVSRARTDLPERCLYWLRTLLKYKLPPGRVLELGSGHGGFVSLLRWAGFDAQGLELSPWVRDFAESSFDIDVLLGPLEDQHLDRESFDVIVLMDVLEHLTDPVITVKSCSDLLKPEGILIVQTPKYLEGMTYSDLVKDNGQFIENLTIASKEHLYLFSQQAICRLLSEFDIKHVQFESPLFAGLDMFLVASREHFGTVDEKAASECLLQTPDGRMVQALIDLDDRLRDFTDRFVIAEEDRAARLDQIHKLTGMLQESESRLKESEKDRSDRLEQIVELTRLVRESEKDRNDGVQQIFELNRLLGESEKDRSDRMQQIVELKRLLGESEENRAALTESLEGARSVLTGLRKSRIYRLMCATGLWSWVDKDLRRVLESH